MTVIDTQTIKDWQNHIIGYIETFDNGDKKALDFYRRILGRYIKKSNITRDFYGKIIGRGDQCGLLIGINEAKNKH